MRILRTFVGIVFGILTGICMLVAFSMAAINGFISGLVWLVGDIASGGLVSKAFDKPFRALTEELREML